MCFYRPNEKCKFCKFFFFVFSSNRSSPQIHQSPPISVATLSSSNTRRVLRPRTEPRSYVESPDVLINGALDEKPRANGNTNADYSSDSSEGEMPPLAPIKELSPSELKQRYEFKPTRQNKILFLFLLQGERFKTFAGGASRWRNEIGAFKEIETIATIKGECQYFASWYTTVRFTTNWFT